MKKSVRIYIYGTVQDVFFRSFVKENAERYDVKGFTRNLEDGRIYGRKILQNKKYLQNLRAG